MSHMGACKLLFREAQVAVTQHPSTYQKHLQHGDIACNVKVACSELLPCWAIWL